VIRSIAVAWLVLFTAFCLAQEAPSTADDPVLEKRVMALSEELRCLVCQNQSLADSNAGLAVDLRNQVRELMRAGQSDDQIREFLVARYGDFVLYNPPVKRATLVLWVGPFVLLVVGAVLLATYVRRREQKLRAQAMSVEDRARARSLLDDSERVDN
jgi:cytochrome c-type biogenesis protein CcmH